MSIDTLLPAVVQDVHTLSLADVAAITGKDQRTIRRWTTHGREDRGLLQAMKTLQGLRFSRADVDAFTRAVPVAPVRAGATAANIQAAIAAGRLAGEKLAKTRLTNAQRNLVATAVDSFRVIGGASA